MRLFEKLGVCAVCINYKYPCEYVFSLGFLAWFFAKSNHFLERSIGVTTDSFDRGHTFRVLYLAVSPDSESIVTGAGDETLRFWNVFTKCRVNKI